MAKVDYSGVPEVSAQLEAPQDEQHIEASPSAFGAPVAEGAQVLAQGALKASDFYGQVAADNGTNNTLQQVTSILHGDPNKTVMGPDGKPTPDTGFFGKRGADAMSARAETAQQIDDIIQENREGLSTPQSKLAYDVDTRRYRAQWQNEMGTYADAQQKVWATDTNTTAATLALNQAARSPTDPTAVDDAQERTRQAYAKNAQLAGEDPQGAILKADQDVAMARIRALVGSDDPQNRVAATKVLEDNAGILGSLPNYDGIVRQVKEARTSAIMAPVVDGIVSDALANARQGGGPTAQGAPGPSRAFNIGNVKTQQGAYGAPASPMDGVVLAANNLRGGYRGLTLEQIAEKWAPAKDGNDPAVWAANVSRASGIQTGQVPNLDDPTTLVSLVKGIGVAEKKPAELGAFTPDVIQQGVTASLAGKHTNFQAGMSDAAHPSADVMSRGSRYPSVADALSASMDQTLTRARSVAEERFPNDPDAQERVVDGVGRRLNQTISQQHLLYEVDTHSIQALMASDNPPMSEAELEARGPDVQRAWRNVQVNNPYGAMGIEKMFDANAKGRAIGYGSEFKSYVDRVAGGDINDPSQLWPNVGSGDDASLTNTGVQALTTLLGLKGDSKGAASLAQMKGFIDQAYGNLSYANPATGLNDPKGEAAFGKFMAAALPVMVTAAKSDSLDKVLSPKSPDYLGHVAATFARTPAQVVADRLAGEHLEGAVRGPMTADKLKQAVALGQIPRGEAVWIASRLGYIQAPGPVSPAQPKMPDKPPPPARAAAALGVPNG